MPTQMLILNSLPEYLLASLFPILESFVAQISASWTGDLTM